MPLSRRLALAAATLVLALFLAPASSEATIPRTRGSWLYGPHAVWSTGSTSTWVFHPLSEPVSAGGLTEARFSWEMTENSGSCKARVAVRYSNDGIAWDTSKEVGSWQTTAGPFWGSTYVNLLTLGGGNVPMAFVQFGVQVQKDSGSAIQLCNITLRVEPMERVGQ